MAQRPSVLAPRAHVHFGMLGYTTMPSGQLESLKCTNHKADRTVVSSARLDLENPCTWCSNRKDAGPTGKAFYYRQFKRWEFPHIAETNCGNYSVIVRP